MGVSRSCSKGLGPIISSTPSISFLVRVQEIALQTYGNSNFDPKHYVDISLKSDLSITLDAFDKLPVTINGPVSVNDLDRFTEKYFKGAGDNLVYAEPVDFVEEPQGFLPSMDNPDVRNWALEVHGLQKNLNRKILRL